MVSPRSLGIDYHVLLWISVPPSCSIAGCLEQFIFLYFFFSLSLKTVDSKTAVQVSHASSIEDDIETQVTRNNHTICGIAVKGNG